MLYNNSESVIRVRAAGPARWGRARGACGAPRSRRLCVPGRPQRPPPRRSRTRRGRAGRRPSPGRSARRARRSSREPSTRQPGFAASETVSSVSYAYWGGAGDAGSEVRGRRCGVGATCGEEERGGDPRSAGRRGCAARRRTRLADEAVAERGGQSIDEPFAQRVEGGFGEAGARLDRPAERGVDGVGGRRRRRQLLHRPLGERREGGRRRAQRPRDPVAAVASELRHLARTFETIGGATPAPAPAPRLRRADDPQHAAAVAPLEELAVARVGEDRHRDRRVEREVAADL